MSYIRTKDGVYKVLDTYEMKYVIGYTEDGFEITVYKDLVIQQADTVEELCDCFEVYDAGIYEDRIWKISSYEKLKDFLKNTKGYYDYYLGFIYVDEKKILVGKTKGGKLELCTGQTLLQ